MKNFILAVLMVLVVVFSGCESAAVGGGGVPEPTLADLGFSGDLDYFYLDNDILCTNVPDSNTYSITVPHDEFISQYSNYQNDNVFQIEMKVMIPSTYLAGQGFDLTIKLDNDTYFVFTLGNETGAITNNFLGSAIPPGDASYLGNYEYDEWLNILIKVKDGFSIYSELTNDLDNLILKNETFTDDGLADFKSRTFEDLTIEIEGIDYQIKMDNLKITAVPAL